MSIQAMTWAWGLDELPLRESMVLLVLADQANDQGMCWPSQDTIAKRSRGSLRSVKRALAYLNSAGLIKIEHRGSQSRRLSNRYHLNIGAEFSLENNQRANLALSETEPVDNFAEIPTFPCEQSKGPDWHLVESESSLSATGGTQSPFNKPKLNSIPNHLSSVKPAEGVLDGVDGLDENSKSLPGDDAGADWDLIRRSLPPVMVEVLPGTAALVISQMLAGAVAQGWVEKEILKRLASNTFPAVTRNAAGLVIHRLKDVLAAPVPGVNPVVSAEVQERRAYWVAEAYKALRGESEYSFNDQQSFLYQLEQGFLGVVPDAETRAAITRRTLELQREIWAQENSQQVTKDAEFGGLKVV